MTVADGEIVRCSARQSMTNDQDHVSVFHYQTDYAAPQTDELTMDTIAEDLDGAFSALNQWIRTTQRPVDMKFDIVEFVGGLWRITRNLGLIVWPDVLYDPTPADDALPPGVAGLVKFLTSIGKVYGRKFIGGLIENAQGGGTLAAGAITALSNFGTSVMQDPAIDVNNWMEPGVVSMREETFVPFTEHLVSDNVAYQRRRRRGTGS